MVTKDRRALAFVVALLICNTFIYAQLQPEAKTKPKKPHPAKSAQIVVQTSPNAEVYIDGQFAGRASVEGRFVIPKVKAGAHSVKLSLTGKRSHDEQLAVLAGQSAQIFAALADLLGSLELHTMPGGAITIDGQTRGTVDNTGVIRIRDLKVGTHGLGIAREGFEHWEQSFTVAADGTTSVTAELQPLPVVLDFLLGQVLAGHTNIVKSIAFSPNGQVLASGSSDGTIRVWGMKSGPAAMRTLSVGGYVTSVAFSPDGRHLLSGTFPTPSGSGMFDGNVKVWDVATGGELLTVKTYGTWCVTFSPDGHHFAGAVGDRVHLWEAETGREVQSLAGHKEAVRCIAYSPDGRWLASGSVDKTLKLWEVSTGREVHTLTGHSGYMNCLVFTPDGKYLASGSMDRSVRVWDARSGREVRKLTGHTGGVTALGISRDGRWLASGSLDESVKLWEISTGREVRTLTGRRGEVHAVAISPDDGRWLASGSEDGTIKMWIRRSPPGATSESLSGSDKRGAASSGGSSASGIHSANELGASKKTQSGSYSVIPDVVARNHAELLILARQTDRDYFEFSLAKKNAKQKVGTVTIELTKTDQKKNQFTVNLYFDDKRFERKDKAIHEQVYFYVKGASSALELVVNKLGKDNIAGYISTPKGFFPGVPKVLAARPEA